MDISNQSRKRSPSCNYIYTKRDCEKRLYHEPSQFIREKDETLMSFSLTRESPRTIKSCSCPSLNYLLMVQQEDKTRRPIREKKFVGGLSPAVENTTVELPNLMALTKPMQLKRRCHSDPVVENIVRVSLARLQRKYSSEKDADSPFPSFFKGRSEIEEYEDDIDQIPWLPNLDSDHEEEERYNPFL